MTRGKSRTPRVPAKARPLCETCGIDPIVNKKRKLCHRCIIALSSYIIADEGNGFANRIRKYGITPTEYATLMLMQNERCAICHTQAQSFTDLVVDHNHGSGEVRGLLCGLCNSGLGFFKDNEKHLKRAIRYLTKPPVDKL